jgi:glycosyltransferase involved in cell wall biosynthesis
MRRPVMRALRLPGSQANSPQVRIPRTRILVLSHYFHPEGNAPASRVHEMARRWVRDGHEVTVITCAPNHPNGAVYAGYQNWPLQRETVDGIHVLRVGTFLAANRGKFRRVLSFVSYMLVATLVALFQPRPDVLIATSPQFFCGWAGVMVAALRRLPFILEIRDIWPESIQAVGLAPRKLLMRILERMERRMYASAWRIVTVGDGYKQKLMQRNVPASKIEIVTNGIDRELFTAGERDTEILDAYGLAGKFVCAYVGTIGMAAGLDVVLRAARIFRDRGRDDIRFLLVGDGATRLELQARALDQGLDNVIFTGLVGKPMVPRILRSVDACLVHLRKRELFESVLPSKIFEASGMGRPVILGVKGCAASLLREARAGICIEPENEHDLVKAVESLAADPRFARALGTNGMDYVHRHFDRDALSSRYLHVIRQSIDASPIHVGAGVASISEYATHRRAA